jgi:hypothetical protein
MELGPNLCTWTTFGPGTDGGIIIGKDQATGGQDGPGAATTDAPGELTSAWKFFGSFGTFATTPLTPTGPASTDSSANVFDDTSNGATSLGTWHVGWNGNKIPMGGGTVTNWQVTDGRYVMDYRQNVPDDCACGFEGILYGHRLQGTIVLAAAPTPTPGPGATATATAGPGATPTATPQPGGDGDGGAAAGPTTGVGSLAPAVASIPAWAAIATGLGGAGLTALAGAAVAHALRRRR